LGHSNIFRPARKGFARESASYFVWRRRDLDRLLFGRSRSKRRGETDLLARYEKNIWCPNQKQSPLWKPFDLDMTSEE
jgi:hypothetical protein